jgi:surface carbohydrate biosynthesis protein (TIGR04326 family)
LFIPTVSMFTPRAAMRLVRRVNEQPAKQSYHAFVNAYLSWGIVARVLRGWFRLNVIDWRLGEMKEAFRPPGSRLLLWPIMREDWLASIRGSVAISNLLWIELFENALRDLPHQRKGLYLCENQAWERAFVHAWRKHGHGQLIAVAHSTLRFWDLRYFPDPRTLRSIDPHPIPQADLMALNGKAAIAAYLSLDYPRETIVECEALRYGYLHDLRADPSSSREKAGPIRVLVLGDYTPSVTTRMLQLLEDATPLLSTVANYVVKPHPNLMVKATDHPSLRMEVVVDPLADILQHVDIGCAGSTTSAAVDAYLPGLPMVVILDETWPNFSPLRGQPGVRFVSTIEELTDALQATDRPSIGRPDSHDFFFLDPDLPRWSQLLAS